MNPDKNPHCVITAGPTYEPLDEVRRLTNFSTGSLGAELSKHLRCNGANVTLLTGHYVTYQGTFEADRRIEFTTTKDLADKIQGLASHGIDAIFHASAVSDFAFGKVCEKTESGELREVQSGKFSTRNGSLFAELVPTTKILPELRKWFPNAFIVGWKFEVEGNRQQTIEKAKAQLRECNTDACVLNGPAIGDGFEIYSSRYEEPQNVPNRSELYEALWKSLTDFMKERTP